MNKPIHAAFIGAGFMGRVHTRAARTNGAILSGIVGADIAESERAAAALGIERPYSCVDEMLADPTIDVVHILTPNYLHAAQAKAVIEAGKHVICEKPLALNSQDAGELTALAREQGVVAAVPFSYRFHPMVREARHRLAGQPITTIHGRYMQDWLAGDTTDWRVSTSSGGKSRAFADIGSHLVDMIEFVTGQRIASLCAQTLIAKPIRAGKTVDTEDAVALVFETDKGAIGTFEVSQVAPGFKNLLAFEISTENETLAFKQPEPETLWIGKVNDTTIIHRDESHLSEDAARLCNLPVGHPMGYNDAVCNFVRDVYASIRGEHPEGLPVFADGLRAVRVTEAVLESAERRSWTTVPTTA